MATMTIRNLDDELKARLRQRAARFGHSMEEEARSILKAALAQDAASATGATLVETIRARVARIGGVDLSPPARMPMRQPPDFGSPD